MNVYMMSGVRPVTASVRPVIDQQPPYRFGNLHPDVSLGPMLAI